MSNRKPFSCANAGGGSDLPFCTGTIKQSARVRVSKPSVNLIRKSTDHVISRRFSLIPSGSASLITQQRLNDFRAVINAATKLFKENFPNCSSMNSLNQNDFVKCLVPKLQDKFVNFDFLYSSFHYAVLVAHDAYRNALIRRGNLVKILESLSNADFQTVKAFFNAHKGAPFLELNNALHLTSTLESDCIGDKQRISSGDLRNMILQLRNLIYERVPPDFQSHINSVILSRDRIELNDFSANDLLKSFIRKLKTFTTFLVTKIATYQESSAHSRDIVNNSHKTLRQILGVGVGSDLIHHINKFKRVRDKLIDSIKPNLINEVILLQQLRDDVFNELVKIFKNNSKLTLRTLFFPRIAKFCFDFTCSDFIRDNFYRYLSHRLREMIQRNLFQLFAQDSTFMRYFGDCVQSLVSSLQSDDTCFDILALPNHTKLGFYPFRQEHCLIDANSMSLTMHICNREKLQFKIRDKKGVLNKVLKRGYGIATPRVRLVDGKLLLDVPFSRLVEKMEENRKEVIMGVDLGLRVTEAFTIFCNSDPNSPHGIESLLINLDILLNKKIITRRRDDKDKICFENIEMKNKKITNKKNQPYHRNPNFPSKFRRLANTISELQSEKSLYLSRNEFDRDHSDEVTLRLDRSISDAWTKIGNLHEQIVHKSAHIFEIVALFYGVTLVRLEDLSWVMFKSKSEIGSFLSRKQMHLFFSQLQSAIECKAHEHGIRVEYVRADNTSNLCSRCGKFGNITNKMFECPHCGLRIHKDLNASRNIALKKFEPFNAPKRVPVSRKKTDYSDDSNALQCKG